MADSSQNRTNWSGFRMAFHYRTIRQPDSNRASEHRTGPVLGCLLHMDSPKVETSTVLEWSLTIQNLGLGPNNEIP